MKQVRERLDNGAAVKDAKRTLSDWLAHRRPTTLAASDRKESTRELYANLCRRHLEPEPFGVLAPGLLLRCDSFASGGCGVDVAGLGHFPGLLQSLVEHRVHQPVLRIVLSDWLTRSASLSRMVSA